MNTSWLKWAGLVVAVVLIIVLTDKFKKYQQKPKKPQEQTKTFYDVIKQDDARLRADINMPPSAKGKLSVAPEQAQQLDEELTVEQKVDAERLFEMALAQRKMGRLPGMTYKLMVDYCREIIEKYPKSSYTAKARRMLADIPEQDRNAYNITDEEINPPK